MGELAVSDANLAQLNNPHLWAMETDGFVVLDCEAPSQQIINTIENSVGWDKLYCSRTSQEAPTYHFQGNDEFKDFSKTQRHKILPPSSDSYCRLILLPQILIMLQSHLESSGDGLIEQGPLIVCFIHFTLDTEQSPLKLAHPCPGLLLFFRLLGAALGPENGMFQVYPGSHRMSKETILASATQLIDIHVGKNQLLVACGCLWAKESHAEGLVPTIWGAIQQSPWLNTLTMILNTICSLDEANPDVYIDLVSSERDRCEIMWHTPSLTLNWWHSSKQPILEGRPLLPRQDEGF